MICHIAWDRLAFFAALCLIPFLAGLWVLYIERRR